TLLRHGGVRMAFYEAAPDRLNCIAQFVCQGKSDEWEVKHRPPRGSGHTGWTCNAKLCLQAELWACMDQTAEFTLKRNSDSALA
ncbi:MAG: hypothetical protein VW891_17280, partial [Novosphingobium sp.]